MKIYIAPNGDMKAIYSDDLKKALENSGWPTDHIERASHVEPDSNGNWVADLSPVKGPRLGPFGTRVEALTAEASWIEDNILVSEVE